LRPTRHMAMAHWWSQVENRCYIHEIDFKYFKGQVEAGSIKKIDM